MPRNINNERPDVIAKNNVLLSIAVAHHMRTATNSNKADKATVDYYGKKLEDFTSSHLFFLTTFTPITTAANLITKNSNQDIIIQFVKKIVDHLKKNAEKAREECAKILRDENSLLDFKIENDREKIFRLLTPTWQHTQYRLPGENKQLFKNLFDNGKLINLPPDFEASLKQQNWSPSTIGLPPEIQQLIDENSLVKNGSTGASAAAANAVADAAESSSKAPEAPEAPGPRSVGQIKLSKVLVGDSKVDGIDTEIVGTVLGNPTLGTDGFKLADASGKPPTVKVYGGMIRFEQQSNGHKIITGDTLATENGEVDFVQQIKALVKNMPLAPTATSSVTVDFVVVEKGRGHFSILSVTIDPNTKEISGITHKDTSHKATATGVAESLQSKFHDAVKKAINDAKISIDPKLGITYSPAPQQKENTCGDRVMLSMLHTHNLNNFNTTTNAFLGIDANATPETVSEKVTTLLAGDEQRLRQFTVDVVNKTGVLKDKVEFTNGQLSAAPPRPANQPGTAAAASSTTVTVTAHDNFFSDKTAEDDRKKWLLISSNNLVNDFVKKGALGDFEMQMTTIPKLSHNTAEKTLSISFRAEHKTNGPPSPSFDITLSRKDTVDPSGTALATWTCTADLSKTSLTTNDQEKLRFQLIAAESLALRVAQGLGVVEAKRIGIVVLEGVTQKDRKPSSKFQCADPKPHLSAREETLIEAHLNAGYKEVHYNGSVFKGTSPAQPAVTTVVVTHTAPPPQQKPDASLSEGSLTKPSANS